MTPRIRSNRIRTRGRRYNGRTREKKTSNVSKSETMRLRISQKTKLMDGIDYLKIAKGQGIHFERLKTRIRQNHQNERLGQK